MRFLVPALAVLLAACPPTLSDVDAGPQSNPVFKHAHNDYEHTRPLLDALDAQFESVEADVYLDGTDIGVSHNGAPFKGSLKGLYLDPLADRVAANNGSVYGDGKEFFLWLDLKQGSQELQTAIALQLDGYAMLTRFDDDGVLQQGAVTVILTGDAAAKKAMVEFGAPRTFTRDSNDYSPSDPPADGKWSAYAVSYYGFMQWDGKGDIPPTQRRQLENLVNGAHLLNRRIRIYASQDAPAYWRAAKAAHLDFVNADDLTGLQTVMAE